ncbi:hypothetical protein Kpho02_63110 [Kitasatospora phosalacinea]|uniref:Alpha-ketoglutarate-dependent dioxygenase AlkB n=1 Tax=Kitasatospora phosalacinea TaxID=2065 RepID=A0A9W6V574_9ACTN|nr:hypothetical protein [Kitasatospora phosalacinea]GLW74013.1 hypothetical protein Kpho02_63110 [Kitasatospora phosalacinea]
MPRAPEPAADVRTHHLPTGRDLFAELSAATRWEEVGKGRCSAVLVRPDAAGGVPLVRTTARYAHPAQRFRPVHAWLAEQVRERAGLPDAFDNALAEVYTRAYTRMGAHSDLALDLAEGSSIAVFSCYRDAAAVLPRTLRVQAKEDGGGEFEVPLLHHGVVVFSVAANRRLRHRIVLDPPARAVDNEWLGVTFRTSRTRLDFRDGRPHLPDGQGELTLATEEQRSEFHRLRRRENAESDFRYPPLAYTVSESDLLPPH